MHTYTIIVLSCVALVSALYVSNVHTARLSRIADCVVSEAKAQGYAGNVYSREAWDLFEPNCK